MNPIHFSAGVIIAIVANTWASRLLPPFLWGFVWCGRLALLPNTERGRQQAPRWKFYAAEYVRASVGSLVVSLSLGSVKALIRYLVLR